MGEKFLTIIVRCYNRSECIQESLLSAIKQTFIKHIHILIIDDGSTDNSLNVIENVINLYPDVDIEIVQHKKNMGRGKALNTAKKYLKGKYCTILDSDDVYSNNTWVENLYNEIGNNTYDILHTGNKFGMHFDFIYLSETFKMAPIPNFNYYEDHYPKWFIFRNTRQYIYKIRKFYTWNRDAITKDRTSGEHEKSKKVNKQWLDLYHLYEDTFYNKYKENKPYNELKERFLSFDPTGLDDMLMETYLEIKEELKL
jgi:glycosyltransferase involved in cell wall biosynthesis